MDLGIEGKRALITGGGRGLGLSIANCLNQEGVRVCIVSRTQADIDKFVKENNSKHIGICCDLMDSNSASFVIDKMKQKFFNPDILIHNVGGNLNIINPFCGPDDWKKVYRLNLEIAIELNLLLLPFLKKQKWGKIIHISSISSLEHQGTIPYCSMKAALNAYTRALGRSVAMDGINVCSVLPGAVFTEKGYWEQTKENNPEHFERYKRERMAIHRFGKPDEIGKFVTFLCSEYSSFVVGSSFLVDGGQGRVFQNDEM